MRREGRPGERAILTSRVVDRPMRPLFPKEMRNDVCITMTVMSLDPDCSPEIAGMIGASLVTAVSEIPWNGPIGGVQVGLVDGEIVLNPTQEQRKVSDLALTVAATMDKIVMIEAGANEVDEDTMLNAIKAPTLRSRRSSPSSTASLQSAASRRSISRWWVWIWTCSTPSRTSIWTTSRLPWIRTTRMCGMLPCCPSWTRSLRSTPTCLTQISTLSATRCRSTLSAAGCWMRASAWMAAASTRSARWLPKWASCPVHGSGMFTRGQTQVLTTCTLGGTKDNQLMDDLTDEQTKRYIHHYNFPPYSVGEARAPRSPGRREIGHGALAERALVPVLPSLEEFPYTIRCVSEVLSSNGSTSQASICGSTLALMDAGVPIKAPVAGISCG